MNTTVAQSIYKRLLLFFTIKGVEEQQALIDALSNCSIHKKKYALELIKLFLKACDEQ